MSSILRRFSYPQINYGRAAIAPCESIGSSLSRFFGQCRNDATGVRKFNFQVWPSHCTPVSGRPLIL